MNLEKLDCRPFLNFRRVHFRLLGKNEVPKGLVDNTKIMETTVEMAKEPPPR